MREDQDALIKVLKAQLETQNRQYEEELSSLRGELSYVTQECKHQGEELARLRALPPKLEVPVKPEGHESETQTEVDGREAILEERDRLEGENKSLRRKLQSLQSDYEKRSSQSQQSILCGGCGIDLSHSSDTSGTERRKRQSAEGDLVDGFVT